MVPVAGSKSSALARAAEKSEPPTMSTFPLASRVAVWNRRVVPMLPTGLKVPVPGSKTSALPRMMDPL